MKKILSLSIPSVACLLLSACQAHETTALKSIQVGQPQDKAYVDIIGTVKEQDRAAGYYLRIGSNYHVVTGCNSAEELFAKITMPAKPLDFVAEAHLTQELKLKAAVPLNCLAAQWGGISSTDPYYLDGVKQVLRLSSGIPGNYYSLDLSASGCASDFIRGLFKYDKRPKASAAKPTDLQTEYALRCAAPETSSYQLLYTTVPNLGGTVMVLQQSDWASQKTNFLGLHAYQGKTFDRLSVQEKQSFLKSVEKDFGVPASWPTGKIGESQVPKLWYSYCGEGTAPCGAIKQLDSDGIVRHQPEAKLDLVFDDEGLVYEQALGQAASQEFLACRSLFSKRFGINTRISSRSSLDRLRQRVIEGKSSNYSQVFVCPSYSREQTCSHDIGRANDLTPDDFKQLLDQKAKLCNNPYHMQINLTKPLTIKSSEPVNLNIPGVERLTIRTAPGFSRMALTYKLDCGAVDCKTRQIDGRVQNLFVNGFEYLTLENLDLVFNTDTSGEFARQVALLSNDAVAIQQPILRLNDVSIAGKVEGQPQGGLYSAIRLTKGNLFCRDCRFTAGLGTRTEGVALALDNSAAVILGSAKIQIPSGSDKEKMPKSTLQGGTAALSLDNASLLFVHNTFVQSGKNDAKTLHLQRQGSRAWYESSTFDLQSANIQDQSAFLLEINEGIDQDDDVTINASQFLHTPTDDTTFSLVNFPFEGKKGKSKVRIVGTGFKADDENQPDIRSLRYCKGAIGGMVYVDLDEKCFADKAEIAKADFKKAYNRNPRADETPMIKRRFLIMSYEDFQLSFQIDQIYLQRYESIPSEEEMDSALRIFRRLDSSEFFQTYLGVRDTYRSLFNEEPSQERIHFWVESLKSGYTGADLTDLIWNEWFEMISPVAISGALLLL